MKKSVIYLLIHCLTRRDGMPLESVKTQKAQGTGGAKLFCKVRFAIADTDQKMAVEGRHR